MSKFILRRTSSHLLSLGAVLALVAGLLVVTATVTPAPAANAATVSVGTIQAQMANQQGRNNGTIGNCITYSPTLDSTSSALVSNTGAGLPNQALTAHGRQTSACPNSLSTSTQSALGFRPSTVTSVADGVPFLIGGMTHYNNPIQANDQYFTGQLRTVLGGFSTPNTLTFNWTMNETPNTGANNCCNDSTSFDNQISDVTLTQGGLTYKLVILGFIPASSATSCPATPPAGVSPVNEFSTVEGTQTNACLYAALQQLRSLRIVKNVAGSPAGTPSFAYTSSSSLTGSAWSNGSFSLGSGGSKQDTLTSGNTVTVTEGDPADDRWSLTGLTCQQYNSAGVLVDMPGTTNLAARRVALDPVPVPLYAANPIVICTYTNTYTPRSTLTLVKQVQGNVVSPTLWTLTATGNASPATGTVISGPSGSSAVTSQRIVAGSYQLAERGTGAAETGFVQVGTWTCTAGGTNYPVSGAGVVVLPDLPASTTVTCTAANRQATGSLQISKVVTDPNSGYTGGTSKTFSGAYNCGTGYTGTFSTLTTGAPVTINGIPAGRGCSVTENAPTAGLLNASFAWGTPTFSTQPVTITDQGIATVAITNPVVQKFGTFAITKAIAGPGGYTGGNTRVFPVAYSCTLTNGLSSSGTLDLTTAQAVSPPASIPTGSVCTFTETLTAQPGDFGDPSYAWVPPPTIVPSSVTIGDNTTSSVAITNTYARETGQLVLAKLVEGAGYIGTGEPFTVGYNCGVVTGTVTLAPGASKTITVPARNTCTAGEVPPSNDLLDPAHVWGTPTWSPGNSGTVPADGSVTLTVTNPTVPVFGKVQVTKEITGETQGVTAVARFDITLDCDNGYADTFTVAVNGSELSPDLPVGTSCTVSEATPTGGLIDSSYTWGTPTIAPNPIVVTDADQVFTATVSNPVNRAYGQFVITKELVDPSGLVDPTRIYSIDYSCLYTGAGASVGTVELAAGESTTITDILLESRCSVMEDPDTLDGPPVPGNPSWVWLPPSYNPGTSVLVTSPTTPAEVAVTNRVDQLTGTFQLTKSVVGSGKALGYAPGSEFTFDVGCTNGFSESVQLADEASWTPTAIIPIGTQCTITETDKPDPNSPAYGWDEVVFSVDRAQSNGSSVTFTVGQTAIQINAINPITPRFGSIVLTKQVTGEEEGLIPGATFQVSVTCGPGNLFVATLRDAIPETVDDIPAGSTCTVFEQPPTQAQLTDASYAWDPAIYRPGATVTIGVGQTVQIAVENPIVRVTAPVRVVKTLAGGQGVIDPALTYPITWSCSYAGQTVASGTVQAVVDPAGVQVADAVPLTALCSATEPDLDPPSPDPAYRWLNAEITGTTVTQPGPNTITVANTLTRDSGRVLVHKTVTGATEGYIGTGAAFTMHGQCLVPGSNPVIPTRYADGDIADGGVVVIAPVSARWTCSGFEDTPGQDLLKDTSYTWGNPVITGDPELTPPIGGTFSLPSAGSEQNFYVENPVVRVTDTFRITKNVVDPFGSLLPGTTFTGEYSCQYGTDEPVTGSWSLTNGSTLIGPAVYLNSVCTATEDPLGTTGLPDGSFAWTAPTITGPVTVVPGGTATATVTNTIQRLYAGLQVNKVLVDPDGGVRSGTAYTGLWTCSLGNQTFSDRWTVGPDASTTVFTPADARVPATAFCSITEDTPDPANLLDGSFDWAARVYSPANVTLTAELTSELTATNTVKRVYSGFNVVKSITGPVAEDNLVPVDRTLTGTYSCQYGTDDPVTGPWTASVATPWVQAGILVGSVCSVIAETPPGAGGQPVAGDPSYIWGEPDLGTVVSVTPPTTSNQTITVTNPTDRLFGRFFITKDLSGATDGITDPQPFPMTYSCQPGAGPALTGDVRLAAGETITVGPDPDDDINLELPVNSVCTLTEPLNTMPPLADSAWTWGDPQFTVLGEIPTAGPVTEACVPPPDQQPLATPCLGFPSRSVTVTIPSPQEDYPEPPNVGLRITNPVLQSFGAFTVAKSSDPASGSNVAPGDTITYSVTVNSTGDVPVHDVIVTDDLSTVLPYVTLGTITAPSGTSAVVNADDRQLVWTVGDVPNGQSRTLTYVATVDPGASGVTIKNLVTATGDVPPSSCSEPDYPACSTTHSTPDLPTISKEPAGAPVREVGTGNWIVPYRITVTNPNADIDVPYTLTDNIAYPTDVPIVSASVTAAPDGVTMVDPPWNGSDQTTIAENATLPGGAAHTYDVAVVASVPPTIDPSLLQCAASGSGGGSGFFNIAAISSYGSESTDDACDPIPVILTADKKWVVNGVSYAEGDQPAGYSATLTLDGADASWRTEYAGYLPGTVVVVGESAAVPAGCVSSASGSGPVALVTALTSVTVVNVIDCESPTPTPNPPTPGPPHPPLPNTGFAVEPFLETGFGLLLAGGLILFFGGRRRQGVRD